MTMFKFREYQKQIINRAGGVLNSSNFVYLTMEVRTGKTLTALGIAEKLNAKNVLFITKKKAISSINDDYDLLNPNYSICVVNYESLHKVEQVTLWDVIVVDEAHSLGAIPKPSGRQKKVAQVVKKCKGAKVILMSGTPSPENYSQLYHQVNYIKGNPFQRHSSFYKFAKEFVDVRQKKIGSLMVNDYTGGKDSIMEALQPFMISFTQKQAGYKSQVKEHFLTCKVSKTTKVLIDRIKKDRVIEGKEEVVLADTPVKLLSKVHQLSGGTIKFESGNSKVIDHSKAQFIKEQFKGKKIGIFYKFKAELQALKDTFGDQLCTELETFNSTAKNIALQIVSGREGISLKNADCLVMYNIDFSATSYWQSRDRLTTKDREVNNVYWVFSDYGIEKEVYAAVSKKKDYTLAHFKRTHLNNPNTLF
jgi:hypothetical protein